MIEMFKSYTIQQWKDLIFSRLVYISFILTVLSIVAGKTGYRVVEIVADLIVGIVWILMGGVALYIHFNDEKNDLPLLWLYGGMLALGLGLILVPISFI